MKKFLVFSNLKIILLIFILIYTNTVEINGIFRIDSVSNGNSLTDENYSLHFAQKKEKSGTSQLFRLVKSENNLYYIENKNHRRIALNENGHVVMIYNPNDPSFQNTMEWNIILLDDNKYIIQNNGNKKFVEINNNFLQCINDLPQPLEEHKSEINDNFKFTLFKMYEEVTFTDEQKEIVEKESIDVLIKYIDLTDENLNRTGIKQIKKDEDNEELKYSVRSILEYIPWVRKIFILMPNEKVKYFKPYDEIKEKIVYVKDIDVLGYESANIYAFTFNLFRLEKFGLSNNFIYMDDDFFIGKELKKTNFFYYDENEKRVVPSLLNSDFNELNKEKTLTNYQNVYKTKDTLAPQCFMAWILSLLSTQKFFIDYYKNMSLIKPTPTHNAISYNIQDLKEIYELVVNNYEYANETLNSVERHILTLQTQHFVDLYEMNIKKRKVHTIPTNVIPMNMLKMGYMNIELFAINTGGDKIYTDEEKRNQKVLMQRRFPNPTPYEIVEEQPNPLENNNKTEEIKKEEDNPIDNGKIIQNNDEVNKILDEQKSLIQITQRQSLIIKLSNCLIVIMIILIIILFYLNYNEKYKNKNSYKYAELSDSESNNNNKKKSEIIDF
jgi:hypothetical protein